MTRAVSLSARRAGLLLSAVLLASCVTQQGVPGGGSPSQQEPPLIGSPSEAPPVVHPPEALPPIITPPATSYPKSLKESGAGAGVLALARQAQDSRAAGKYDAAVGQLERALRIEPKNPFIWQALADAHLQLQHADQAESAAQKSNSLARGNPYVTSGNWRVIASARALKGDGAGARIANSHADETSAALPAAP